jgi:predicted nucleic acid-binding protein
MRRAGGLVLPPARGLVLLARGAQVNLPVVGFTPDTIFPAKRESAAHLRALGLRTPDALHAATALASGCILFLTNDPVFKRVTGLSVVVLSEVVAAP